MLRSLFLLALAASFTSCATVVTGRHDVLKVESCPSGATFTASTGETGVTPAEVEVPSDADVRFTFEHEGYADTACVAKRHMSGWIFGNALLLNVPGLIIDLAGGGAWTHSGDVSVALEPLQPVACGDAR
ncbi:MAG: hypothetical protein H6828_00775 [Planctomycetes bacterium]|nr:hypothetical protein [Planctomycetota bacterium]